MLVLSAYWVECVTPPKGGVDTLSAPNARLTRPEDGAPSMAQGSQTALEARGEVLGADGGGTRGRGTIVDSRACGAVFPRARSVRPVPRP